jgi:transcriptional regulator GlxA family with amidase domain
MHEVNSRRGTGADRQPRLPPDDRTLSLAELAVAALIKQLPTSLPQGWTTEVFCQVARVSPSHLRRIFSRLTGQAPMHYLKQLRLLTAAQLLTSTLLSVKEICAAGGYQDFSHFVRDFRECYGRRPTAYRTANRCMTPLQHDERHGQ